MSQCFLIHFIVPWNSTNTAETVAAFKVSLRLPTEMLQDIKQNTGEQHIPCGIQSGVIVSQLLTFVPFYIESLLPFVVLSILRPPTFSSAATDWEQVRNTTNCTGFWPLLRTLWTFAQQHTHFFGHFQIALFMIFQALSISLNSLKLNTYIITGKVFHWKLALLLGSAALGRHHILTIV